MMQVIGRRDVVEFVAVALVVLAGCSLPRGSSKMGACQFNCIDRNDNGEVTRTEYREYTRDWFQDSDVNNDGKLQQDEFVQFMVGRHRTQDANDDGFVNHAEIVAATSGKMFEAEIEKMDYPEGDDLSHFEMVDVNDDGVITREEYTLEGTRWVRVADQNDDGKRSVEETETRMEWLFDKIDDNDDGVVKEEEMTENYVGEEDK